jgi:hypothetical protein
MREEAPWEGQVESVDVAFGAVAVDVDVRSDDEWCEAINEGRWYVQAAQNR